MLEKKRAFLKLFPQRWKQCIIQNVLVCWRIDFPSLELIQLAQCSQAGNILLALAKPRLTHQTAKQIHHSTEQVSTAPESSGSMLYAGFTPQAWASHQLHVNITTSSLQLQTCKSIHTGSVFTASQQQHQSYIILYKDNYKFVFRSWSFINLVSLTWGFAC